MDTARSIQHEITSLKGELGEKKNVLETVKRLFQEKV